MIVAWIVLGLIAGALERWILPRPDATFLGSMALGWTGALLGSLVGYGLGLGEFTGFNVRSLAISALGVVLILGGLRLVYRMQGRSNPGAASTSERAENHRPSNKR